LHSIFLRLSALCTVGIALALSACETAHVKLPPPRSADYVVLLPNNDGTVGKVLVMGNKGEQVLADAGFGAAMDGATAPSALSGAQVTRDFGQAMGARPALPEQFYLYFQTGGSTLTAESQALLPTILAKIQVRESADVSVVGHSDTTGKADANARLALQRAQAIAMQLKTLGMQANTITIESHGEANLLVATPDETAEPRNRRVEITVR
jgi:adhesin transport system outer membrane protein